MVELQFINKILEDKDLKVFTKYGVSPEHFVTYKNEINYIMEHHGKFGVIPDKETIIDKFPDFDFVSVGENYEYLTEKLLEQYTYNRIVPVVHKIADLTQGNANDAVEFMKAQVEELNKIGIKRSIGYDIVQNIQDRVEEYKFRTEKHGLLGITTGLKDLDKDTFGWLAGEELVVILGRTNEGKSWIMQFFLTAAWKSGKKVLMYSGEMGKHIVGFRFDTLNQHFSNLGLMSGDSREKDDYVDYAANLKGERFIVITPKDLGGERLDVKKLEQLVEIYQPDIIGIDQLSLMEDCRAKAGDPNRIKLTHISEDLFALSEKHRIPILTPSQANRDATKKNKSAAAEDDAPEAHHISESDGVGQNASRVISIKQVAAGIKIAIKKNRYGVNNKEYIYAWDIDRGVITDIPVATESEGETEYTEGEDLF